MLYNFLRLIKIYVTFYKVYFMLCRSFFVVNKVHRQWNGGYIVFIINEGMLSSGNACFSCFAVVMHSLVLPYDDVVN